jgi:Na+/H+ antiporter NhaD/arsenite permease-like protein
MEWLMIFVVPGFVGGLVVAALFIRLQQRGRTPRSTDAFDGAPSTDVINIARIRVAGVGGLGLVVMAFLVAVSIPRIGQSLALGLILGAAFAAILILLRRGDGGMASSGRHPGANTVLAIDDQAPATSEPGSKLHRWRIDSVTMPTR